MDSPLYRSKPTGFLVLIGAVVSTLRDYWDCVVKNLRMSSLFTGCAQPPKLEHSGHPKCVAQIADQLVRQQTDIAADLKTFSEQTVGRRSITRRLPE